MYLTKLHESLSPVNFNASAGAIIGDGDRKRGVHAKPSKKTKCAIFSENCATLNVINSRGYTQICVGLSDSIQTGLEARLHAIDKRFD